MCLKLELPQLSLTASLDVKCCHDSYSFRGARLAKITRQSGSRPALCTPALPLPLHAEVGRQTAEAAAQENEAQ